MFLRCDCYITFVLTFFSDPDSLKEIADEKTYDPSEPTDDYDPCEPTEDTTEDANATQASQQDGADGSDYDPAEPTLSDEELDPPAASNENENQVAMVMEPEQETDESVLQASKTGINSDDCDDHGSGDDEEVWNRLRAQMNNAHPDKADDDDDDDDDDDEDDDNND